MNCLERSLQIAGTVKTNLTFSGFDKTPRELSVLRQWSLRYLMEREKTSIAGIDFPDTSLIRVFLSMFCEEKIDFTVNENKRFA